jgi:pimeloyl-ACP methyl ester carboxylesterase
MVGVRFDEGDHKMTTTPRGVNVMRTTANVDGAPTLLFIHGFLDDATVWDGVITSLADKVNTVRYDLPGFGTRAQSVVDPRGLSLEALAAEAVQIVRDIATQVIVVGQSLGAQVAELVAAAQADKIDGLVLLTPVPVGGTRLPDDAVAPFRALGGDTQAQRRTRTRLSPALDASQLDQLDVIGGSALPHVVARYVDLWNDGHSATPAISEYCGPVLIIRGGTDAFVTEELVGAIAPRFGDSHVEVVGGGGHWLHLEYPERVAALIVEFSALITGGKAAGRWRRGFADGSQTAFMDGFADEVVLEASTLVKPIEGKANVSAVLAAASSIYDSLEFTAEAHTATTSYLQWRATAFGGMGIKGVTILERDVDGKVVAAAIHHRPLAVVARFSAEIRDRLAGVVPADHFLVGNLG